MIIITLGTGDAINYITGEIRHDSLRQAKSVASLNSAYMNAIVSNMETIAGNRAFIQDVDRHDLDSLNSTLQCLYNTGFYRHVVVLDPNGTAIMNYPYPSGIGVDYSDREYYQDAMATRDTAIGSPIIGKVARSPVINVATPVINDNGSIAGVLMGSIELERISSTVKSLDFDHGSDIYIVDEKGYVVHHSNYTYMRGMADFSEIPAVQLALQGKSGTTEYEHPGEARDKVASYAPVSYLGWGVVVEYDKEAISASMTGFVNSYVPLLLAMLTIIAVLAYLAGNAITRPVLRMARSCSDARSTGCLSDLPVDRHDEIGMLAASILEMSKNLIREREMLSKETERMNAILSSAADGICIVGTDGRILWANNRMNRWFADSKGIEGVLFSDVLTEIKTAGESSAKAGAAYHKMYRALDRRGRKRTFEAAAVPLKEYYQDSTLMTLRDVTQREINISISNIMAGSRSMDEMLGRSLEMLKDMMNLSMVSVYTVDEKNQEVKIRAYSGMTPEQAMAVGHQKIGPDSTVSGYVAYSKKPMIIDNIQTHERRVRSKVLKGSDLRSFIVTPLIVEGNVVGVFNAASNRVNEFKKSDVKFLGNISNQLAISMRRMMLDEELSEAKRTAELYVDLMSHDVNNMNTAAMGFMELALDDESMSDSSRTLIHRSLEKIRSSSDIIENVKKLQKIRRGGMELETVNLGELIGEAASESIEHPEKIVSIDYPKDLKAPVRASPLLKDVFLNLIGNSIKYSEETVFIDIKVDRVSKEGQPYYAVSISDYGRGIPDNIKPQLFNRYYRGTTAERGAGLGLYLVKSIIESFGGWVEVRNRVEDNYREGAKFIIYLPVPQD